MVVLELIEIEIEVFAKPWYCTKQIILSVDAYCFVQTCMFGKRADRWEGNQSVGVGSCRFLKGILL